MALGLSVVAIGISVYTIKLNPISLSEPNLNWMIGFSVTVMSLGITAVLGIQISSMLSIDKRFQKEIEKVHAKYKVENEDLAERLRSMTITVQKFTTGNIYITGKEYNDAFCVFCLAAIDANKIGEAGLVSKSLDQAVSLFDYNKDFVKSEIGMKYINLIKEGMIGIPDEKAILIYNFLSDFQQVE